MDYDVIIAGAGPGGCATALRLVQLDTRLAPRILVLDRACFPRTKPCGGGLTGHAHEALRALDVELDVPSVDVPAAVVRYGSFTREIRLARPVRMIRRTQFDHALVDQVRTRGIEVVEGEGIVGLSADGGRVSVRTSRRELTGRVIVGADGAGSIVRRHLRRRWRGTPHRLFVFEGRAPGLCDARMIYDFSWMPRGLRGYMWMFPAPGGRVNAGLMHYPSSTRRTGAQLAALLCEQLAAYGVDAPAGAVRGWPAWGYHPRAPVSAPRIVCVGDAAGIDGLTGEGIAVAMEHALVAAQAIVEALAWGDVSFDGYRARLRRAVVGRELALDRWLARLLYGRNTMWRWWLPLVLFDPDVLALYAARVAGTTVLADHKRALYRALVRHMGQLPARRRALEAATLDQANARSR